MPPTSVDIRHFKINHADFLFFTQFLNRFDFVHIPFSFFS